MRTERSTEKPPSCAHCAIAWSSSCVNRARRTKLARSRRRTLACTVAMARGSIAVVGWKTAPPLARGREHAVDDHAVKVQVVEWVECGAEAVNESDRADARASVTTSRLHHAPGVARGTHPAPLAGERDQEVVPALRESGRGQSRGRECRIRDSGGSRARRRPGPRRCRPVTSAMSGDESGSCDKAGHDRAAAADTAWRRSSWSADASRGPCAPDAARGALRVTRDTSSAR